jgi:hypothetical protein
MAIGSRNQYRQESNMSYSDFEFVGEVCKVEKVEWKSIVDSMKNGGFCKDAYTYVARPSQHGLLEVHT